MAGIVAPEAAVVKFLGGAVETGDLEEAGWGLV